MSGREDAAAFKLAAPFQVGLLCPRCQRTIEAGGLVRACASCGITHHAPCWAAARAGGGCSSYHCDPRTSAAPEPVNANVVNVDNVVNVVNVVNIDQHHQNTANPAPTPEKIKITKDEAARAEPPRPRARAARGDVSTADLAARYAQAPARTRPNRPAAVALCMALLAVAITGAAFAMAPSAPHGSALAALAGLLLALGGGITAALAIGSTHRDATMRGGGAALAAILLAVTAGGGGLGAIMRVQSNRTRAPSLLSLTAPEPPAPETFEGAPPAISNAMRANVFVSGRSGLVAGTAWCGAGVILGSLDGRTIVITNRHVADGGGENAVTALSVIFADGKTADAEVIWRAGEGLDLALLACAGEPPVPVRTRLRSAPLHVSEKVFAIGNPHALAWTYTEGVVSRVFEMRSRGSAPTEVVQSQTPIQQGNSGGGLYDVEGRLAGINTWAIDPDEARGPGFSISVRTLVRALPERYRPLIERASEGAQ